METFVQPLVFFLLGVLSTTTIGAWTFGRTLAVLVAKVERVEQDVSELTKEIRERQK
jgi:hypothetical protein